MQFIGDWKGMPGVFWTPPPDAGARGRSEAAICQALSAIRGSLTIQISKRPNGSWRVRVSRREPQRPMSTDIALTFRVAAALRDAGVDAVPS